MPMATSEAGDSADVGGSRRVDLESSLGHGRLAGARAQGEGWPAVEDAPAARMLITRSRPPRITRWPSAQSAAASSGY